MFIPFPQVLHLTIKYTQCPPRINDFSKNTTDFIIISLWKVKISSQFLRGNNFWIRFKILQTQEQVNVKNEPWSNKRGENHLLIYCWETGVLKELFLKGKKDWKSWEYYLLACFTKRTSKSFILNLKLKKTMILKSFP